MVQARTENNQIRVGVQQTSNITKVSATDTNASNPVSAANNKAHIYERQAYQHSETARTYADKAKQSAENSANSALRAEESANLILNDKGFIETTQSLKNINTVANNIDDVDYVANNAEKIEQIVEDLQNLGDTTNINIVATNINSVNTTAENIEAVKTVSDSAENVNVVVNNLTSINYVAENIEDIQTVEENKNLVLEKVEEAKGYSATASSQAVIATEQATKASQMANSASSSASGASSSASSALSSANTATEKANIAITNAEIAITNAEIATTQASNALSSAKNAKTSETNALTYQNNANSSANTASQKANEAIQSASNSLASSNNSKIWAEGTDEEVQALGGEHSSKRWAEIGGGVDIENKVSKSGDTMTGTLNFSANVDTADIRQVTTFNDVTIGEIPQKTYFNGFKSVDSQGKEFANVNCSYNTNGRMSSNFYVVRSDSGKSVSGALGVAIDLGGESAYGYAPNPTEDSNTNHIATTEWSNKKFLDKSHITSCLLKVPNKINFQLGNDGATLKAGSKFIVPNKAGVFDEKTITSDMKITLGSSTGTYVLTIGTTAWGTSETSISYYGFKSGTGVGNMFSGGTQPTATVKNSYWYDTTNNVVKTTADTGATWVQTYTSLPFAIVTASSGKIVSIDHIFNGFGNIGSVWWVDKDVEALISRGYNNDGTINNVVVKTTKVSICNQPASDRLIILTEQGVLESIQKVCYFESEEQPSLPFAGTNLWYNPKTLEWKTYKADLGYWQEHPALPIAWDKKNSNGQITDFGFVREKPFRAMDYNEAQETFAKPIIGQIIRVTASSSYVPEGTLYCDGAEYSATQFNALYNNWLVGGKLPTCTYSQFQTEVTNTGACYKWAIDTTNKKFKVPKIPDTIIQGSKDSALVEYDVTCTNSQLFRYPATDSSGVTNPLVGGAMSSDNTVGWGPYSSSTVTAANFGKAYFNGTGVKTVDGVGISGSWVAMNVDPNGTLKANLKNSISTSVVKHFVIVANGSINQAQMDWSQWASGLNSKANTNLSNVTQSSGLRRLIEVSEYNLLPSWYKVFEETNQQTGEVRKWCEQGGQSSVATSTTTINLLKSYAYISYNLSMTGSAGYPFITSRSTGSFVADTSAAAVVVWEAKGYIN